MIHDSAERKQGETVISRNESLVQAWRLLRDRMSRTADEYAWRVLFNASNHIDAQILGAR